MRRVLLLLFVASVIKAEVKHRLKVSRSWCDSYC